MTAILSKDDVLADAKSLRSGKGVSAHGPLSICDDPKVWLSTPPEDLGVRFVSYNGKDWYKACIKWLHKFEPLEDFLPTLLQAQGIPEEFLKQAVTEALLDLSGQHTNTDRRPQAAKYMPDSRHNMRHMAVPALCDAISCGDVTKLSFENILELKASLGLPNDGLVDIIGQVVTRDTSDAEFLDELDRLDLYLPVAPMVLEFLHSSGKLELAARERASRFGALVTFSASASTHAISTETLEKAISLTYRDIRVRVLLESFTELAHRNLTEVCFKHLGETALLDSPGDWEKLRQYWRPTSSTDQLLTLSLQGRAFTDAEFSTIKHLFTEAAKSAPGAFKLSDIITSVL